MSTTTDPIVLSDVQWKAATAATQSLRSGRDFSIGGYAGTGKTTILSYLSRNIHNAAFCAYTGKAASVLRKKGVNASTIHSQIYVWRKGKEAFELIPKGMLEANCFIIDEASMVGADIYDDLKSFGVPILTVGDPAQLEPVGSTDINLMKDPDIVLTEIHRQAFDNPIIDLSQRIRQGKMVGDDWTTTPLLYQLANDDPRFDQRVNIVNTSIYSDLDWADIIICGFQKTRIAINREIRQLAGFPKNELAIGDRIICLQNDKALGVFNGLSFTVQEIKERITLKGNDIYHCTLIEDDTGKERGILVSGISLNKHPKDVNKFACLNLRGQVMIADYGYAITCHKAQGSEWDKVSVIREGCSLWDQQRWDYTAVTRASKELRVHV